MGTHPIFESDFDCLTEKKFTEKPSPDKSKGVQKRKKPAIPFILFSKDKRAEAMEIVNNEPKKGAFGQPGSKNKAGGVQKLLGKMWNELSAAEKKPYIDQYEANRAKYLQEIENDKK